MTFCSDTDLLYWEPGLFADAAGVAQKLLSGEATVNGPAVTIGISQSLPDAGVVAGSVITFSGGDVQGSFPIVSIDSNTQLTMTALYDGLDAETLEPALVADATSQQYVIRTFYAHRRSATEEILIAAGLDPTATDGLSILNPQALKRPCVLRALWMIYTARAGAAMASAAAAVQAAGTGSDAATIGAGRDREQTNYTARAAVYERLYWRALRSVQLLIDTDGDGRADVTKMMNLAELRRG
jgi:hypothetical protein